MKKIVIVGAGVSGVFAAIKIKQALPLCEVVMIEGNQAPLRKLLATGNGRCNLSNSDLSADHYDGDLRQPLIDAIMSFHVRDELMKLGLMTKFHGSLLYPVSEQAATVRNILLAHVKQLGISILCDELVIELAKEKQFTIITTKRQLTADYVLLACGTKAGGHSGRHDRTSLLDQMSIRYRPFQPSLTKMTTLENVRSLKGVRVKGKFALKKDGKMLSEENGELLFTDYGVSGIAVMNLSRYYEPGCQLIIDMMPECGYQELRRFIRQSPLQDPLTGMINEKLCRYQQQHHLEPVAFLKKLTLKITGLRGFDDAQVAKGGVLLSELNDALEVKKISGLYCLGELLNVTGDCGGYNLHFALTTGYLAGKDIVAHIMQGKRGHFDTK